MRHERNLYERGMAIGAPILLVLVGAYLFYVSRDQKATPRPTPTPPPPPGLAGGLETPMPGPTSAPFTTSGSGAGTQEVIPSTGKPVAFDNKIYHCRPVGKGGNTFRTIMEVADPAQMENPPYRHAADMAVLLAGKSTSFTEWSEHESIQPWEVICASKDNGFMYKPGSAVPSRMFTVSQSVKEKLRQATNPIYIRAQREHAKATRSRQRTFKG